VEQQKRCMICHVVTEEWREVRFCDMILVLTTAQTSLSAQGALSCVCQTILLGGHMSTSI
jgi:hypothetical protein